MALRSHDTSKVYLLLTLCNTLAASLIWGINTLFLLDAGLSNLEAFSANAFFTLGQVIFEIPTGIVADTVGRRASYLLGTCTLAVSTLLYFFAWQMQLPFWSWAVTSILLGLGFTFFSGATEAWLVDSLAFTKNKSSLEEVMAKGQMVGGGAMLVGSVLGGVIAQHTNLGVPYILRAIILIINFAVAFFLMKDLGFTPKKSQRWLADVKDTFATSLKYGWGNPSVRWVMLAAPFTSGVGFYVFYAMQPHLLNLYGNSEAYGIAGLAAAIIAGAQILGGMAVPYVRKLLPNRLSVLLANGVLGVILLLTLSVVSHFWLAIGLFILWGLLFAAVLPVRQAYLNNLIPSQQRATVLSFDSLVGSSGGIVIQPVLGKVADVWSYPLSYAGGALFQLLAIPFILLAKKERSKP
ncbi:MAG TPA: MFS transporter [Patescibacteria group bacterium]